MMNFSRRSFISGTAATALVLTTRATSFAQRVPLTGQEPAFETPEEGLQLLLEVQRAELALYEQGLAFFDQDPLASTLQGMAGLEQSHIDLLTAHLGDVPPTDAAYTFEFADATSFWAIASVLEGASVSCVQGLMGTLQPDAETLNLALGIHENDARQLAVVEAQRSAIPIPLAIHPTIPVEGIRQILAGYTA